MHRPDLTRRRPALLAAGLGLVLLSGGCAAVTNPAADGIPVRRLPPEAFGESRSDIQQVPLAALTPPPAGTYKLAPGDILGVFVEGILGERGGQPPVRPQEQGNLPPGIGYPIPVRENGTVPLPLIEPLNVAGLTLDDAQTRITQAYLGTLPGLKNPKKLLKDETSRIIVTLLKPRQYHVLVLREDAGGTTFGTAGGFGAGTGGGTFVTQTRKAAGFPLDLPAYENDLLNALSRTGGLPGAEATDEVLILRGAYQPGTDDKPPKLAEDAATRETIRVPLRLRSGQPLSVRPEQLILRTGDVVHVRARPTEVFFTGGLLPPRAFPLPADRDLDVLEAVALVGGPLLNGGVNANNLSGQIVQTGLGFPSPSQVTILRKLKGGGQIPIVVSLNRAVRDPRERIAVRPNDFLILQSTVKEAEAQYLTSNFRLNFIWSFLRSPNATGTATATAP
ncbi:MAG TPA: polysaccharide biosynthesis/export family protein [Gemmataceae bacterium]|nr:polysaccharide biosynthesis/export family protein [Gemmataceae bacterium]